MQPFGVFLSIKLISPLKRKDIHYIIMQLINLFNEFDYHYLKKFNQQNQYQAQFHFQLQTNLVELRYLYLCHHSQASHPPRKCYFHFNQAAGMQVKFTMIQGQSSPSGHPASNSQSPRNIIASYNIYFGHISAISSQIQWSR